jgi:hypothetical protein
MFSTPDGTLYPLIDLCGDSSEDEAAAGGPCDAFVEVGDALALAVDASEDDECCEEEPARAGMWYCMWINWRVHQGSACVAAAEMLLRARLCCLCLALHSWQACACTTAQHAHITASRNHT